MANAGVEPTLIKTNTQVATYFDDYATRSSKSYNYSINIKLNDMLPCLILVLFVKGIEKFCGGERRDVI